MSRQFWALALAMVIALKGGGITGPSTPTDTDVPITAKVTTIETGKLHMSTNRFPPYVMRDNAGNYIGIDIEVADAIAAKLGLELVVDDMDFDAALMAVQTGQSDIAMTGITVTEDRKQVMDFSNTYTKNVQVVIVKEGSPIATVDDLAYVGGLIGTQLGTTGYQYCPDEYGDDRVVAYDSGGAAIQALRTGQVDTVVIDKGPAEVFVAADPGLKILDTAYADEDYAVAVRKGNTQLLDAINQAIAQLQEDGTLQSIADKYIKAITVTEGKAVAAVEQKGTWWLMDEDGKLLEQAESAGGVPTVTGLTLLTPAVGAYLATGEEQSYRVDRLKELLGALSDNGMVDKLGDVDLSEDHQVNFDYDCRFTIHLSPTTEQGMSHWLRRFKAALDNPKVDVNQSYTVEIMDGETLRFIPK